MIKWNLLPTNVVVRFAPLAGGKFFVSMLSYYENFQYVLPITRLDYASEDSDFDSLSHYLKMRTIPEKKYRDQWFCFEFQIREFWGFQLQWLIKEEHYHYKYNQISIADTYNLIPEKSLEFLLKRHCFHIIHESSYKELKMLMPNCKIITLVEAEELQKASVFKQHHTRSKRYIDVLEGKDCHTFSMKNVFNKKLFFDELSTFSFKLTGSDSFDPQMEEYYDKYVEIHKS